MHLKPSYEVPLIGLIGANAQGGIASDIIDVPFRINGLVIVFGDDHVDNVLHYFLVDDTNSVDTTAMSTGRNIISPRSPYPYFIGHSMIRGIKVIREFPEGNYYLKVHVVNNNAYQIQVNVYVIVEEI